MRYLILGKGLLGHEMEQAFHDEDFIVYGHEDLDLTNPRDIFEKLVTVQPDVVINATGYTNVDLAEKEEEKAKEINGYAVGVLARICREIDATLVHFSTDYVFSGTNKSGYNEEDQPEPLNAYGRSKLLGEQLLIEEMESLSQERPKEGKYFLIRTSWLFGKNGKNFVDTMIKIGMEKIVTAQQTAAASKNEPAEIRVVNDQHGKPTWAKDLAEQTKWLLKSHEYPSGIYHITNEGTATWYDFALKIFELAKIKIDVLPCSSVEYPRPAKRPAYSALKNNILPKLRSWEEALIEYLKTTL